MKKIKSGLLFLCRFIAGVWSLGFIAAVLCWLLVYFGFFPVDSKMTAFGFLPPYVFFLAIAPPVILFLIAGNRWLAFFLFLNCLAFFIGYGDFSFQQPRVSHHIDKTASQKFSAAAMNVRYYSYGLDNVIDAMRQINADLYLISENRIMSKQVNHLKKRIAPKTFHMGRQNGTAIISRYPVLSFREIPLPSHQALLNKANQIEKQRLNPRRSFVHAVIDVNGVKINAISIRFLAGRANSRRLADVIEWGFYVLEQQVKEIEFFENYLKTVEGPIIFGGDINATPSSFVVRRLSENAADAYLADHLWGGFTFWSINPSLPFARLDYLFCSKDIQPERSKKWDVVVSDHFPVYAEFTLPRN